MLWSSFTITSAATLKQFMHNIEWHNQLYSDAASPHYSYSPVNIASIRVTLGTYLVISKSVNGKCPCEAQVLHHMDQCKYRTGHLHYIDDT